MILVDTSVWVEHLRKGHPELAELLFEGRVLCHPFVIGELACGTMTRRDEILSLLGALPKAKVAEHEEALELVSEHGLFGKGLGWVDVHILASASLSECPLFTQDKALHSAAQSLKLAR